MPERERTGEEGGAAAKRPPSGLFARSESALADSDLAQSFEPLYTADEMRAAEERYPGYPDSIPELMERAGTAVAREAMLAFPDGGRFACVCGKGSNGGDGRVAARVLREAGRDAEEVTDGLDAYDVVVDALFGTGFRGEPRSEEAAFIGRINASLAPVISVDLPSGVDASTGEVAGAVVDADVTVTLHAPKAGLAIAPGRFHSGRVVVADIGLVHGETRHRRATAALLDQVPRRAAGDTKYSAGSVLVVGGQPGMTGAACLTALAAFRADAGYVTLAVPEASLPVVEGLALEPVKIGWSDDTAVETIATAAERAGALALGPGLGRGDARRALVRELLERLELPAVVDADALFDFEPVDRSAPTVLTPHAGELARLLGTDSAWVGQHRLEAAMTAAERFGAVLVLKGADTIVAAPGTGTIVCDIGTPALATAGTGDVLTGVVASFLAKGLEPQLAAAAGAVAQQLAAARSAHQAGLVAGDLIARLPAILDG
jgi:ADP-dependent NAD(P)H-hydrate dehydratase / NAD(P)H-hydrate epimerase